ncbi:MAG: hypothetical protein JNL12_00770 [Planctomycetes bacterium]|nr:hypothetical protein [Planctomycetota bacterium]
MQFVFVYQREPHAGQMAFADIQQPADLGERVQLARRTCEAMALPPDQIWVDGMDDQSRALFGNLPSPAIVVDPFGVIRAKLPWAEPELLAPLLKELVPTFAATARQLLQPSPEGDAHDRPDSGPTPTPERQLGAKLFRMRQGGSDAALPVSLAAIAASTMLPTDTELPDGDPWLRLVAAAAMVAAHPDDARCADWLALLATANEPAVRQWELQRRIERLRRSQDDAGLRAAEQQLAALQKAHAWLVAPTNR